MSNPTPTTRATMEKKIQTLFNDKFDEEDLENDWAWEVTCNADIKARLERLESSPKLSRYELYEELLELMALLEVYWRGLKPERQQATAKQVREVLRKFEALKTRMQDWAAKELRTRIRDTGRIPLAEWDEVCREDM